MFCAKKVTKLPDLTVHSKKGHAIYKATPSWDFPLQYVNYYCSFICPPSFRVNNASKFLSRLFLSCPLPYCQSFPVQSSSILSYSVVSCPKLLFSILSCPVLPCHISILSGPVPTVRLFSYYLFLFCLVLQVTESCHALSSSYRLSWVLSC
jgi:hypothetical protein